MQNRPRPTDGGPSQPYPALPHEGVSRDHGRDLGRGVQEARRTVRSSGARGTRPTSELRATSQSDEDSGRNGNTAKYMKSRSSGQSTEIGASSIHNSLETNSDGDAFSTQSLPEAKVKPGLNSSKPTMLTDQAAELLGKNQEMTSWLCRHREKLQRRRKRREKKKTEGDDNAKLVKHMTKRCNRVGKEIDASYQALGAFADLQRDMLSMMQPLCDEEIRLEDQKKEDALDSSSCSGTSDSEDSQTVGRYGQSNRSEPQTPQSAIHVEPSHVDKNMANSVPKVLSLADRKYHSFLKSKRTRVEDDNRLEDVFLSKQTVDKGRSQNIQIVNNNIPAVELPGQDRVSATARQTGSVVTPHSPGSRTVPPLPQAGRQLVGTGRESGHRRTHGLPVRDSQQGNSSSHDIPGKHGQPGQNPHDILRHSQPRYDHGGPRQSGQGQEEPRPQNFPDRRRGLGQGRSQTTSVTDGDGRTGPKLDVAIQRAKVAVDALKTVAKNKSEYSHEVQHALDNKRQAMEVAWGALEKKKQDFEVLKQAMGDANIEANNIQSAEEGTQLSATHAVSGHSLREARSLEEVGQSQQAGSSRAPPSELSQTQTTVPPVGHRERTQPKTRTVVPVQLWDRRAKDEIGIAKSMTMTEDLPETGMYTVLCLDISDSMKGEPWSAMAGFVDRYLHHVESESQKGHLERVAMVTFGHDTRVVQYFSTDYQKLRISFDHLYADGPSPMYGGLTLTQGICCGGGKILQHGDILLYPRVLLVTDGHPTSTGLISGPDVLDEVDSLECLTEIIERTQQMRAAEHIEVFMKAVGNSDLSFLTKIAGITGGSLMTTAKEENAVFMADQNTRIAGCYARGLDRSIFTRGLIRFQHPELSADNLDLVRKILKHYDTLVDNKVDQDTMDEEATIEGLPPIGSRVRRGPEWNPLRNDDSGKPGTIVGHRTEGQVRVFWDSGVPSLHDYGYNGRYEVVVVDEPRKLDDDEDIAIGCFVKKGKECEPEDTALAPEQIGCVYSTTTFGLIKVIWSNGENNIYKYGYCGAYEVEICSVDEVPTWLPSQKALPGQANRTAVKPSHASLDSSSDDQSTTEEDTVGRISPTPANGNRSDVEEEHKPGPLIIPYKTTATVSESQSIGSGSSASLTDSTQHSTSGVATGASASAFSGVDSVDLRNARNAAGVTVIKDLPFAWQYKDVTGKWITHTSDVCRAVETAFQSKPPATCIVYINDQPFRVVTTSKMQQIHLPTGTVCDIQRVTLRGQIRPVDQAPSSL